MMKNKPEKAESDTTTDIPVTDTPASIEPSPGEATTTPTPGHPPEDLQRRLQEQEAKTAEYWDKLLRVTADFDNFKKRVAKERAETFRYAYAPLLHNLLTVLDNFEMALAATGQAKDDSVQSLQAGVNMIFEQLQKALQEAGLKEIDARGQPFDPNIHEAISQMESTDVPEGHVLQQLRKGYQLHDRLLRAATVVVAKAPAAESLPSTQGDPQPE